MMRAFGVVACLVACVVAASAQTAPNATNACPITDYSKVDWTTARDTCATQLDSPNFCSACICGVGVALVVGLDAAGVRVNGQSLTDLAATNSSAVNALLTQCQTSLGLQLLQSNTVTPAAVSQLAKCDVQAAGNNCLGQVTSGAVGGVATPVVDVREAAPAQQVAAPAAARSGAATARCSGCQAGWSLLTAAVLAFMLVF